MVTVNNKEQEMNERIRELAEQAEWRFADRATGNFSEYDQRLEKFAELIVRNCIVDFYRNYLDTTSDEDITKQVDRYVKQQFGVE
jgi:hypothetical protein